MWLLKELSDQKDQPPPRFSFLGTVNWMRGLAILCKESGFSNNELQSFYSQIQRRNPNQDADILAFECLIMAMHNVFALDVASKIDNPYALVRLSIIAWYYASYYAGKAMLASATGVNPQTHAKTSKLWQTEIVSKSFIQKPFNYYLEDLTSNKVKTAIELIRGNNCHDLKQTPTNQEMAKGAIYSYLKGTSKYEKWRLEEQVKNSSEFKKSGFTDFRKKAAKEMRDKKLMPAQVNYLVQAFRYRGKANYRDAIYLSYGDDNTLILRQLMKDLYDVAKAFVLMAAHYTSRRVTNDNWINLKNDLNQFAKFKIPFEINEI